VLRGASITLYATRPASQGEDLYLNVEKFLKNKKDGSKAFDHKFRRIGLQRKAPQNNFRRLIAAPIPKGRFCFESINYCTGENSQLDLDLLIAFLNSGVLEWYFRTSSTNAQINEYQFNILPVPTITDQGPTVEWQVYLRKGKWNEVADLLRSLCTLPGTLPATVAKALTEMSRQIQEIEAKRVLKNRSERAQLAPESQPIQDVIDAVLFRCYGLSEDDAKYIEKRLEEML